MHTDRLRYSMGVGMGILYRFPYKIPYVKKLQTLQFVGEDSPLDDSDAHLESLLDFAISRLFTHAHQGGHVLGTVARHSHAQLFQNGQEVQQRGREDGFDLVSGRDSGRGAVRD